MRPSISIVLASYNSRFILEKTLVENIKCGFKEIIIVDGLSTDGTCEFVNSLKEKHPEIDIKVESVPKKGLANARNIGTKLATGDFVLHAGPDNIMTPSSVQAMHEALKTYDLVSCETKLSEKKGYLDQAHDIYKKRYAKGKTEIVGTPYLGSRDLFLNYPFNEFMLNGDDTEFCQRLVDDGKTIYRVPEVCYEFGFSTIDTLIERWMRWGRSDALFYELQSPKWALPRKVKSWLHPVAAEIVSPMRQVTVFEFVYILPFIAMTMVLRYLGWARYLLWRR